jgi:hypothetical protein
VLGGGEQRGCLNSSAGYSSKAHCIGKWSYLEPIRGSLLKSIGGGVAIGSFLFQWYVGNARRVYLERIRNRMHEPTEGLLARLKKIESRSRIAGKQVKTMLKTM